MGVLDDAIREHLDLKRRHGVAEEELRRQEEEALGPARREVAPAETDDGNGTGDHAPAELEAADPAHAESAAEHADEPQLSEVLPDTPAQSDTALEEETAVEEEPALHEMPAELHDMPAEQLHPEALQEEPLVEDEPPAAAHTGEPPLPAEPPSAAEPPPPGDDGFEEEQDQHPRAGDTPPQGLEALDDEFLDEDDEAAGEGEETGEDADLLEDTPDFLQETPEHDRLWFEQKPPRDFDFD